MKTNTIINELKRNLGIFQNLLKDQSPELVYWKADEKKWCLLEIICHLYDEEREDFRARVKICLESPDQSLPPIDPVGWVKQRKYLEKDFETMLQNFSNERKKSVKWLNSLKDPNWDNFIVHPALGKMSALKFLQNWLVHDFIHIRQILKLKYDYLEDSTSEDLTYAGNW